MIKISVACVFRLLIYFFSFIKTGCFLKWDMYKENQYFFANLPSPSNITSKTQYFPIEMKASYRDQWNLSSGHNQNKKWEKTI